MNSQFTDQTQPGNKLVAEEIKRILTIFFIWGERDYISDFLWNKYVLLLKHLKLFSEISIAVGCGYVMCNEERGVGQWEIVPDAAWLCLGLSCCLKTLGHRSCFWDRVLKCSVLSYLTAEEQSSISNPAGMITITADTFVALCTWYCSKLF